MALVNVPAGSLIIPMDTTYQNLGMFKAYGLVYRLLSNGIPVIWAIAPGKPFNGTDFTASAVDFQTAAPVINHNYTGGPFIIDAAFAAAAAPIISAWQGANTTTVHTVTAPFVAPEWATPLRRPRIAVEQTNASIVFGYLNAAGIPDANGNPWSNASPGVLDPTDIANGVLFENPTETCKRRAYDIFLSPHTSDSTWTDPNAITALDDWVKVGGYVHSMCHSISAIENVFFFITTTGIPGPWNKGEVGTFTVDVPDYGLDQAVPTTNPQPLPGGSEQTWLRSAVTYRTFSGTMAHFLDKNGIQYDIMASGPYKGGTGAGTVSYEGGHQYSSNVPYLNNNEAPYVRFVYNAVLLSVALPQIVAVITPTSAPVGVPTLFTVTVTNTGGQPATNLNFAMTPAPGVAFVPASDVPPATIAGPPTWTWTDASFDPGETITFQINATPAAAGENPLISYTATYADNDAVSRTLDNCASINAQPGANPVVVKTPLNQNAFPNQNVNWQISFGNTGLLALNGATLTDTIPAGLTFISSVPAPSSVAPGPGGTTILTYNLGNIPAATPVAPYATITVLTPPATTANYTNSVTLTGSDINGNQYSVTATAELQETDRAPIVDITSPLAGDLVSGITNVTWTASDPDGDPLTFDVFYSPDCSSTLIPIATGVVGNSVPWNTSLLNGSNFCVTVVASDGLLTGQDTEGPFQIDNTPPTVEILTPAPDGSTICGLDELTAEALDNVGVVSVSYEYSIDGGMNWVSIGTAISGPPWSQPFETSLLPDGPVLIRATATDQAGLTGTDINSYIIDNTPPTAAILAPPNGSTVEGTVVIQGNASDNIQLVQVEWRIDGNLAAIQTTPPFSFVWDTTQFTDGPHTVTLTAVDGCGNTAVAEVTYIVDNIPDCAVQVGVDGTLSIPSQKPPAAEILDYLLDVEITKTVVIQSLIGPKVIITGVVHLLIKYVAEGETQKVHAVHYDLPFNAFVVCPNLVPGDPVDTVLFIEKVKLNLLDPRSISKFIVFLIGVEPA